MNSTEYAPSRRRCPPSANEAPFQQFQRYRFHHLILGLCFTIIAGFYRCKVPKENPLATMSKIGTGCQDHVARLDAAHYSSHLLDDAVYAIRLPGMGEPLYNGVSTWRGRRRRRRRRTPPPTTPRCEGVTKTTRGDGDQTPTFPCCFHTSVFSIGPSTPVSTSSNLFLHREKIEKSIDAHLASVEEKKSRRDELQAEQQELINQQRIINHLAIMTTGGVEDEDVEIVREA
ncbi:hypothetical protein LXL04_010968 [Taraxacum kok-saghyz]